MTIIKHSLENQLRIFIQELGLESKMALQVLKADENLLTNGWIDSLKWIQLLKKVQIFYGIEITASDLMLNGLRTLNEWMELIQQKKLNL